MSKPTFQDKNGRSWRLELTVGTARQLKADLDVDLYRIFDEADDLLARLAHDDALFVDLLFVVLEDELAADGMSDVDFAKALNGQAVAQARGALGVALGDFFPDRKPLIDAMRERVDQVTAQTVQKAAEIAGSEEVTKTIERTLEAMSDQAREKMANFPA